MVSNINQEREMTSQFPLRLAAAAGALMLAGAAGPGLAHEQGGDRDSAHVEKIIVITSHRDRDEGDRERGEGRRGRHVEAIRIDGAGSMADCGGARTAISQSTGNERERTRVVFCSSDALSAVQRAEKLEHVLARINSSEHLSAESKGRVAAAIRRAIEELRSAP
jgi:hypothetical protein